MRSLITPPGSIATLLPVPGCAGFFCELNSSMRKTDSILMELPIHGKSNVTLTRPIPQIPGIPTAVTTTPPLYMVGEHWSDIRAQPKSQYEYKERCGILPKLPPGYTYNPLITSFATKVASPAENSLERYRVPKDPTSWRNSEEIPNQTTRTPIKEDIGQHTITCPQGFSMICPYPGFDPVRVDLSSASISPIYGRPVYQKTKTAGGKREKSTGVVMTGDKNLYQDYSTIGAIEDPALAFLVPQGTTLNRHPVLFPCRIPYYIINIVN
jgi:hypothetical protein